MPYPSPWTQIVFWKREEITIIGVTWASSQRIVTLPLNNPESPFSKQGIYIEFFNGYTMLTENALLWAITSQYGFYQENEISTGKDALSVRM